jgi:HSP20 family protein
MTMVRTERKRNDDINDIFSTFDEEFEEMRERMNQMMGNMLAGQSSFGEEQSVYGVSVQMGQDGKPLIKEFGNMKRAEPVERDRETSDEPLTDVIEEKDRMRVIVGLPGVQMGDISVCAEKSWLDITVDTEHKKFSRRIEMPCPVRSDSAIAAYKNGVLEVTMDREPPKRRKKRTIVP